MAVEIVNELLNIFDKNTITNKSNINQLLKISQLKETFKFIQSVENTNGVSLSNYDNLLKMTNLMYSRNKMVKCNAARIIINHSPHLWTVHAADIIRCDIINALIYIISTTGILCSKNQVICLAYQGLEKFIRRTIPCMDRLAEYYKLKDDTTSDEYVNECKEDVYDPYRDQFENSSFHDELQQFMSRNLTSSDPNSVSEAINAYKFQRNCILETGVMNIVGLQWKHDVLQMDAMRLINAIIIYSDNLTYEDINNDNIDIISDCFQFMEDKKSGEIFDMTLKIIVNISKRIDDIYWYHAPPSIKLMNMVISKLDPDTKRDTLADVLQFLNPLMLDGDNVIDISESHFLLLVRICLQYIDFSNTKRDEKLKQQLLIGVDRMCYVNINRVWQMHTPMIELLVKIASNKHDIGRLEAANALRTVIEESNVKQKQKMLRYDVITIFCNIVIDSNYTISHEYVELLSDIIVAMEQCDDNGTTVNNVLQEIKQSGALVCINKMFQNDGYKSAEHILQKTQKLKKTFGIITTKMTQQARAIRNKAKTKPIQYKPPKHAKQSIKYVKHEIDDVISENEDETNQNTVEQIYTI
eukprot:404984_1